MTTRNGSQLRELDARAELQKLAHVLDVAPDRLDFLAEVPPADLRALRAQIGEAMFEADRSHFARVAALSKTVPGALSAKITETVLPPLLAARTAELLEPERAVDMVGRISDRYLADVSAAMDPARSPEVVAAIPPERVTTVGLELAGRGEWVTMGGFVAHISDEALAESIAAYTGEQLLHIGYVLDDLTKLEAIGQLLTDEQVDAMLEAAPDHTLWAELADLLQHLSPARLERMRARYEDLPRLHRAYRDAAKHGDFDPAALALLTD